MHYPGRALPLHNKLESYVLGVTLVFASNALTEIIIGEPSSVISRLEKDQNYRKCRVHGRNQSIGGHYLHHRYYCDSQKGRKFPIGDFLSLVSTSSVFSTLPAVSVRREQMADLRMHLLDFSKALDKFLQSNRTSNYPKTDRQQDLIRICRHRR